MLTDELYRRLSGAHVDAYATLAIVMCTTDGRGWPHPAMLSYYEVAAIDRERLRIAVYNDSGTCRNMRERGKATLILADENLACYIRCGVSEVTPAMASAAYNAMFAMRVDHIKFDTAPEDLEPGAFVTTGIRYRPRTGPALEQARAVLAELVGRK
jgi:hypothetical protein